MRLLCDCYKKIQTNICSSQLGQLWQNKAPMYSRGEPVGLLELLTGAWVGSYLEKHGWVVTHRIMGGSLLTGAWVGRYSQDQGWKVTRRSLDDSKVTASLRSPPIWLTKSHPWSSLPRSLYLRQLRQKVSSLQQWSMAVVALGWDVVAPWVFWTSLAFRVLWTPILPPGGSNSVWRRWLFSRVPPVVPGVCSDAVESFYCVHRSVSVRISSELYNYLEMDDFHIFFTTLLFTYFLPKHLCLSTLHSLNSMFPNISLHGSILHSVFRVWRVVCLWSPSSSAKHIQALLCVIRFASSRVHFNSVLGIVSSLSNSSFLRKDSH